MCRVELPPGAAKLFEEATRRYFEVKRRVDCDGSSWGALTKVLQREMNEVIRMWHMAADQGHAEAQFSLGLMYNNGHGVKQDYHEAVRLYRLAAEAARWFRKAAAQGTAGAEKNALLAEAELRKQRRTPRPSSPVPASTATPISSSRTCVNCGAAEMTDSVALKPCSRCKAVVYCGKACQAQHWKLGGHRSVCK